jgi:hypothetical protein
MGISDIRTRVEALNERSHLIARGAKSAETPALTFDPPSEFESIMMRDPLIQALVDKLPQPNAIWTLEERAKWLRAAAIIFNLVYRTDNQPARTDDRSAQSSRSNRSPMIAG